MQFSDWYTGKSVLLTGHSSGIGLMLCKKLLHAGAQVIGISRTTPSQIHDKKLYSITVDLCDSKNFVKIKEEVALKYPNGLDIVVHSAGIGQRGSAANTHIDTQRKIMEINFFALVQLYQITLPLLKPNATWVAISSVQGILPMPHRSIYSASKFALEAFLFSVHLEHRMQNKQIRMVICRPGFIATAFSKNALTADGKNYAITDKTTAQGISPQRLAQILLTHIAKDKRKKIIIIAGIKERIGIFLFRYMQWAFDWLIPRIVRQQIKNL